jgi:hypothetical protein
MLVTPLAKRIGAVVAETVVPAVAGAVAEAVATVAATHVSGTDGQLQMRKAAAASGPGAARPLAEVRQEILDVVSAATGERNPVELVKMIDDALGGPVNVHAEHDAAVAMAKAIQATTGPALPTWGPGLAEAEIAARNAPYEHLATHAPDRVSEVTLREIRSDAAAVAFAKTIQPTVAAPPAPRPDRRAAIREELARATADGLHPTILDHMRAELQEEEVRAIVARPNGRMTLWGGAAHPLT